MAVQNVSVETRRESQPQVEYGLLVYRLEWTNFAAVDGDRIEAGNAIDQFFLDSQTSLRFTWPDGYSMASTMPDATSSSAGEIVWEGQRDFDPGEPRLVVTSGETPTATATDGGAGGDGSDGSDGSDAGDGSDGGDGGDSGSNLALVALLVVAALAVTGGVWLFARRNGVPTTAGDDDAGATAGESESDAGGDSGGTGGPPPELLSNEERVLRLLDDNGGRMKQKQVAEQLDWTAAKTSQVVSDLRDADELDSFRLGRENVLTLPDVDIEGEDDGTE